MVYLLPVILMKLIFSLFFHQVFMGWFVLGSSSFNSLWGLKEALIISFVVAQGTERCAGHGRQPFYGGLNFGKWIILTIQQLRVDSQERIPKFMKESNWHLSDPVHAIAYLHCFKLIQLARLCIKTNSDSRQQVFYLQ